MRTYLVLKDKVVRFNANPEIQSLLADVNADDLAMSPFLGQYTRDKAAALKAHSFDRVAQGQRGLRYEWLDQLLFDLLMGVR